MDRIGLLAMGQTAKSSNGGMHLFIHLLEEPILSFNGGTFINL